MEKDQYPDKNYLPFVSSIFISLATAITTVWSAANVYYLSLFKYQHSHITSYTNSLILLATVVFLTLSLLASTNIIKKIGSSQTIKLLSLIVFCSQFAIFVKFNLTIFVIFSVIIPTCCLYVSLIPNLNLLWTHYVRRKSICTAISVILLDLGSIFWNILFVYLVNPNNQQAIIDNQGNGTFSQQLVQSLQVSTKKMMMICSSLFLLGALLSKQHKDILNEDQKGLNGQKKKKRQLKQIQLQQQDISKKAIDDQQTNKGTTNVQIEIQEQMGEQPLQIQKVLSGLLRTALKQIRCLLIFLLTIIFNIYPIFLVNNLKFIYLPYINDDQFLVNMLILYNIMNMVGAFIWGCTADKKGIKNTLAILVSLSFIGGLLGFFSINRIVIIIFIIAFGLVDRGMETIVGPALAEIFGTKTASLLLPYKGLCFLLSNLISPLIQLLTANFLDSFSQLKFMSIFCLISAVIGIYYYIIQNKLTKQQSCNQQRKYKQDNSNKIQSDLQIQGYHQQSSAFKQNIHAQNKLNSQSYVQQHRVEANVQQNQNQKGKQDNIEVNAKHDQVKVNVEEGKIAMDEVNKQDELLQINQINKTKQINQINQLIRRQNLIDDKQQVI